MSPQTEDDVPQIIHIIPKLANMLFSPEGADGGGGARPHALIGWETCIQALLQIGDYPYDGMVRFVRNLVTRGLRPTFLTYGDRWF